MAAPQAPLPRLFLSYARGDDEQFARRLHADLEKYGFEVWWDRESLHSVRLTFHQQIKDAIHRIIDRMIYVGGPKAAVSDYVREEWRFALECDKPIIPIIRLGEYNDIPGELSFLHCEDFRDDGQYSGQLAKLIANLERPEPPLGKLYAVPRLPPHFLGRPDLMRKLKDAVLVDLQKPVVITGAEARMGVQGMGGIGKSVLASALARDCDVRRSYPDGIVWVHFGQKPDLVQLQSDLAQMLGSRESIENETQGSIVLENLLASKATLLVLDDVWKAPDAMAFDVLGPRCRAVVTTRDAGILHALDGVMYPVELLTETEARRLLADAVGLRPDDLPSEAAEIIEQCGCLPLAVALCGGMAKAGIRWTSILDRLRRADLDSIADRQAIYSQHRDIHRAMLASVEVLDPSEQRRFAELAVFANDHALPEAAVATLWQHTGNLNALDTEALLVNFAQRSLVRLDAPTESKQPGEKHVSMHDLLHDLACKLVGDTKTLNEALLAAYDTRCRDGYPSGPNDGYFFERICHHLAEAGRMEQVRDLLVDCNWLRAKLQNTGVPALLSDFNALPQDDSVCTVRDAIRLSAHVLNREPAELESQLYGRLAGTPDARLRSFVDRLRSAQPGSPRLRPRFGGSLAAPSGPLIRTLDGRTGAVDEVVSVGDGRVASAGTGRVQVWNVETGAIVRTREGYASALALTDDRCVVFASESILYVWDIDNGEIRRTLEGPVIDGATGHLVSILALTGLPGGRVVSGSTDHRIRVWSIHTGELLNEVREKSGPIYALARVGDHDVVYTSIEYTVRLLDVRTGEIRRSFMGHSGHVHAVAVRGDRRLISGSRDNTVRVWNMDTGELMTTLEGHLDEVRAIAILDDGRVVSASDDRTLRVWDIDSGRSVGTLVGHSQAVTAVTVADGRVVSASDDGTLRVWDVDRCGQAKPIEEAHRWIQVVAKVAGECVVSVCGYFGHRASVWSIETGKLVRVIEGKSFLVPAVPALGGRRLILDTYENSMEVWDAGTGSLLRTLQGHSDHIQAIADAGDGLLISASIDGTMRVWDIERGKSLCVIHAHGTRINALVYLGDGRAASASDDHTVGVWSVKKGKLLKSLEAHSKPVSALMRARPDLVLSSSYDDTLRGWNVDTGKLLWTIEEPHSDSRILVTVAGGSLITASGEYSSDDSTLRVWDLETGRFLRDLEGHAASIRAVVSLDSDRILSISTDGTLRVWNIRTGEVLTSFTFDAAPTAASYLPDNGLVVVGDVLGGVHFLDLVGV